MMRVELTRRLLRPSNAPPPPPAAALSSLADLLDENMPASRPVMPPPPDLPPLSLLPLPPPTEENIDMRRSFSPSSVPWAEPPRLKDARDGIPGAANPTPVDPCCERDRPSPGAGASKRAGTGTSPSTRRFTKGAFGRSCSTQYKRQATVV